MKKSYFFLLAALVCLAGKSSAQSVVPCVTDEMYRDYKARSPQVAEYEKIQEEYIKAYVSAHPPHSSGARTTAGPRTDTDFYYIPVVFHVIHNYGQEFIPDATIYKLIAEMNNFYSLKNDTSNIIKTFKKYVGKANIKFFLATKDPNGNPTNGITRRRSYLTYGGDDWGKLDLWPPTSYYNIWSENYIGRAVNGGTILAYANFPSAAAVYPYNDGVIVAYPYVNDGNSNNSSTLDHETGHYFNLLHTWNSSGKDCGQACGDDEVDDTPPTKGHYSTCPAGEIDTACDFNYFKIYSDIHGNDSLVNYPDTNNVQNTMDYSLCVNMFTKGQVVRMHAALNSDVGGRNNLWDSVNLLKTGVGSYSPTTLAFTPVTRADLKAIPEFSATTSPANITKSNYLSQLEYFVFPNVGVTLHNESWNDTIVGVNWQFPSSANPSTSTSNSTVNVLFSDPGWADVKLTATGNGSGDTTADFPRSIFVADAAGTNALGYFQEFNGADTAKWPMFNYYNNSFKWSYANVGFYDHNCVMYNGYDKRYDPLAGAFPVNEPPTGDVDDLFTIPFDLSSFGSGPASLNFYYSGASRSSNTFDITDSLFIDYSTGKSTAWTNLAVLAKSTLCNKGAIATSYVPSSGSDWSLFSINVPGAARTAYTVFRFRYKPNTSVNVYQDPSTGAYSYIPGLYSSGNNFYMDRFTISPYPAGVGAINMANTDVVVAPNPTNGSAYVIVKDADNTAANVIVTDITGKVVYRTTQPVVNSEARILIPHEAISVQGMYLVQTITGNQVRTQKLVVE